MSQPIEEPYIISFSSWNTVQDDRLEVPKRYYDGLPDWANVALNGFDEWLRFWKLDSFRDYPGAERLIELGMNVPPPTESEALRNAEYSARAMLKNRRGVETVLNDLEYGLWRMEQFYLKFYERHAFRRRFGVYDSDQDRFKWIAGLTNVGERQARAILREVSLIIGEMVVTEREHELDMFVRETIEKKNDLVLRMSPVQWQVLVEEVMRESTMPKAA